MAEQCGYCGRFMALVDYGPEGGMDWVCSRTDWHIAVDPEHWVINSLDTAVRIAKIRAGLDPAQAYPPARFYEHLGPKWEPQFWARQVDRVLEAELASSDSRPS